MAAMRYRLRTLLILLAILPPLLWLGWTKYEAWKAEQERQRLLMLVRYWDRNITIDWQAIRQLSATPQPPADDTNQDTTPDPEGGRPTDNRP
jgi:hypothetical protein